jgi:N-acetylmuramoyl-L-alanine amidase
VVVGVAFLVATLFTAWTPGQAWPTPPPLADTSIALPPLTATPLGAPTATPRTKPLIGIVAGHWKHDSGAVCDEGLPSEVTEESINLTIASLVQKRLVEMGYDADLLAEFDPRLQGYQSTALISIHNDSCEFINPEATGFKVAAAWATRHPENAARLTACLRSRYAQVTKLPLHSTSVTADMSSYHAFEEIDETTPAVIIETGFMNLDREFLTKQPEVATDGIVAGLVCYLKNESVESSPVPGASAPSAAPTPPPTPQSNP